MAWRWTYDHLGPSDEFPTQADAEAWLGDAWQSLAADGVGAVTLEEDGRTVYGPMSLAAE